MLRLGSSGWLVLAACLWLPSVARAAPSISSASCAGGSTLVLQGSGFGAKPKAAPVKWDDFEAGAVGQSVGNGWYTWSNKGALPKYAADVLRIGSTRSVVQDFTTSQQYNCTLGLSNLGLSKIYISFWKQTKTGGSGPSRNYKILSLRGGAPGEWGAPEARHDIYPETSSGHIYITGCQNELGNANEWGGAFELTVGAWQRFEYWVEQSSPNVADGKYYFWLDGKLRSSIVNKLTRKADCPYTNLFINAYFATDTNGAASMHWLDDIYVDSTQARVEVCEGSTWAGRQHCEIQIPQAWSSTATPNTVTVKINRGSFSATAFAKAYLYVVDAGGVASSGHAVPSCGAGGDAGPDGAKPPLDRGPSPPEGGRPDSSPAGDGVQPRLDARTPAQPGAGCSCALTGAGAEAIGLLALLLLAALCRRRRS